MFRISFRARIVLCLALVAGVVVFASVRFGPASKAGSAPASALLTTITAVNNDALVTDVDADGKADPGDTLEYTIVVTNSGAEDATSMIFSDTLSADLTLVGAGTTNTSPIAHNDAAYTATGNVRITIASGSGVLANDIDPDTGTNAGLTASAGATSTQGGNVAMSANGSFAYNPAPGFTGTDTFTYTVTDAGGATDTGTVTFNVSGMIWFVNAAAGGGGDGRLTSPFNCYTGAGCFSAVAADDPGDNIFLYSGAYTGGNTLLANQRLIGQGATASLSTITGITPPAGSDALPATGGVRPTMTTAVAATNAVNLGSGNTLRGFDIGNTTAADIAGTGFGTLTASEMDLTGTGGALNLTTGTLAATFTTVSSSSGSTGISLNAVSGALTIGTVTINGQTGDGINITNSAGNVTINGGSIGNTDDPAGNAVEVNGSNGNVTIAATLTKTTAGKIVLVTARTGNTVALSGNISATGAVDNGIDVNNNTAGIVNFTGQTQTLTTGANTAVNLVTNGTGVNNFAPAAGGNGLDITTTSGIGFNATGGGTFTVQGAGNTITSTTGTALTVSNATIGAPNMTFQSITAGTASDSAGTGIILDNTGSTGGLTVSGNASAGSGGTIQHKNGADIHTVNADGTLNITGTTGVGIFLRNTKSPSFAWMQLNDFTNFAILGSTVTGLTLSHVVTSGVNGSDPNLHEGAINFDNLTTSASIINTTVAGGLSNNFSLINTGGTLNRIVFDTCTFGAMDSGNVNGNDSLFIQGRNTATVNVTVQNTSMTSARGDIFQVDLTDTATSDVIFKSNTVNNQHPFVVVGGGGLVFSGGGTIGAAPTLTYDIGGATAPEGNTFRGGAGDALLVVFQTGHGTANGKIRNNTFGVAATDLSGAREATDIDIRTVGRAAQTVLIDNNQSFQYANAGIMIQAGDNSVAGTSGTIGDINATITNNTVSNFNSNPSTKSGIHVNLGTTAAPADTTFLCADIQNNNAPNSGSTDTSAGSDYVVRQRQSTTMRLPGYAGSTSDIAAVANYIKARNTNGASSTVFVATPSGGGGYTGGAGCVQPPIAPPAEERESAQAISGDLWVSTNDLAESGQWTVDSGQFWAKTDENPVISASDTAQLPSDNVQTPSDNVQTASDIAQLPSDNVSSASDNVIWASADVGSVSAGSSVELANVEPDVEPSRMVGLLTRLAQMISPTVYSAPAFSGETVTINGAGLGFTLPAGKAVTIKFRATIDAPPPFLTQVTNQGSVSGTNFTGPVLTDDPSIAGPANPTLTVVDSTTVVVTSSQNPSLTGQPVTFTATLTGAPVHATGDPGGTVEFFEDGNSLGAPVAVVAGALNDNTGTATLLTSAVPAGSNVITAVFSGGGTGPGGFNANSSATTGGTNVTQVVGTAATWDGSASSDWHNAANWTTNFAPLATHSALLPTGALPNEANVSTADATVTSLTISLGRSLQITGRTLTITSSMAMNGGNVDSTTTGLLVIDDGATLTRTTGIINTPVSIRKEFTAGARSAESPQAVFVFPVGTSTGFSPLTANVTAGSNGTLTVKATNGTIPSVPAVSDATTLDRYWTLTETGTLTADLTFQYLPGDVDGTEANYRLLRGSGGSVVASPNNCASTCVNPATDTIVAIGVQTFDNFWTAGEPVAPTAANVGVSGRVFNAEGRGVAGAIVRMTDQSGNTVYALTNPFGYYHFDDVASGQNYVMTVTSKQYTFAARTVSVSDNITDLDFIAEPEK